MTKQFEDIMRDLKSGKYEPIYLLMGEEPYYIDAISNYIEKNALTESDAVFNKTIFYGKDADVQAIIHEAEQYPMMAERRLVMLKEAQELNTDKGGDKAHFDDFAKYAEHMQETTILVICYKYATLDKRGKLYKAFDKAGCVMESPKMYDNQLPAWITRYVTDQGLGIDTKACEMLAEAIGMKLANIAAAVEKLKGICADEKTNVISSAMVSKHVGISNEYNMFELRDALLTKNVTKANLIVKAFGSNEKEHPVQATIAYLFTVFEKLFTYHYLPDKSGAAASAALGEKPYPISKIYAPAAQVYSARKCLEVMDLLREYDMKSKGYHCQTPSTMDLMRELVSRILN